MKSEFMICFKSKNVFLFVGIKILNNDSLCFNMKTIFLGVRILIIKIRQLQTILSS